MVGRLGRQHQDPGTYIQQLESFNDFDTIQLGNANIKNDDIRSVYLGCRNSIDTIIDLCQNMMSILFKQHFHSHSYCWVIIYYQYL